MLADSVLLEMGVLLALAAFLGVVAQRLRQHPVLGYLLAGMLLGPSGLHTVRQPEVVAIASETGTALLLFVLGLEFSWSRLRSFGGRVLRLGLGQILLTFAVVWLAVWAVTQRPGLALVWAGAIALSSTATVGKILEQERRLDSPIGRATIGTLLLQDVAVIPLLLAISALGSSPTSQISPSVLGVLGRAALFAITTWALGKHLLPWGLHWLSGRERRELQVIFGFAFLGLASWAAHALGLSPALAAFLLGAFLGESEYAVQLRADVAGVKEVFLCVFFASAGMYVDVTWLATHLPLVASVAVLAVGTKVLTTWAAARLAGWHPHLAFPIAISLAQLGEFSFVLVRQGIASGVMDASSAQVLVILTVFTLALTPLALRLACKRVDFRSGEKTPKVSKKGHVVVVGFGPAGQTVAAYAQNAGLEVTVVDLSPKLAREARATGAATLVGDATHWEILEKAGVPEAAAVVVTIPDDRDALRVAQLAARAIESAPILVRARHQATVPSLEKLGVVPVGEEALVGEVLAAKLLDALGTEVPQGLPTPRPT